MARVLAVSRNIDRMPIGGVELLGSVYGAVPNDGLPHALAAPAGMPPLVVDPTYRMRVAWARVEWSTVDLTVPPPLTLTLLVNGSTSVAFTTLARLMLQAVASGTPAIEADLYAEVQAGAVLTVIATNTGAVNQLVCAYLWGWAYAQAVADGAAYDTGA
jgi:hypothetical protein